MFSIEVAPHSFAVTNVPEVRAESEHAGGRLLMGGSPRPLQGASLTHENMYKHLVPLKGQRRDESSVHRAARIAQLPGPTDVPSALAILGDTADAAYPIYRFVAGRSRGGRRRAPAMGHLHSAGFRSNGAPPDSLVTVATATFDFVASELRIYTENPKTSHPSLTVNLDDGSPVTA